MCVCVCVCVCVCMCVFIVRNSVCMCMCVCMCVFVNCTGYVSSTVLNPCLYNSFNPHNNPLLCYHVHRFHERQSDLVTHCFLFEYISVSPRLCPKWHCLRTSW